MKRLLILFLYVSVLSFSNTARGDDSDLFTTQVPPNILIILDNSNSMDEDFWGKAVGSYSPDSKAVTGKKALMEAIEQFKYRMRLGLMTYRLSGVSQYYLHDARYFTSYQPKSYCPDPPSECVQYAKTGDAGARSICTSQCRLSNPIFDAAYLDDIITHYPIGSEQRDRYSELIFPKSQRTVNPSDSSKYIYFKSEHPFYDTTNWGTAFCYAPDYNPDELLPIDGDAYDCYRTKTETSDDSTGYDNLFFQNSFEATDSDYALGYGDYGRRHTWYYVGRTWYASASPGNGYLTVSISDLTDANGQTTATYTTLNNKLDPKENDETGYMSCAVADKNTCPYVINAGLTPTAGTFQSATDYFKGTGGYTSPITAKCQKNFIIYVTDGLPSVNESGAPGSADSLMPSVLTKMDALRSISKTIGSTSYPFDVKTYVLGLGLSEGAKAKLDQMAVHGGGDVDGHAYYADSYQELIDALGNVFSNISQLAYSFTSPTVPSVRMIDNNRLYVSSFIPEATPFWEGFLKAYNLNSDGTLDVYENGTPKTPIWEASIPPVRTIRTASYVCASGKCTWQDKDFSAITAAELGVSTTLRNTIVTYVTNQKLGDIYHSNSVVVGSPSSTFEDDGFNGFRETSTVKNRSKVVIVGANDGMLHAFDESTGVEKWAFIPNCLWKSSTTTGSAGLDAMRTAHKIYVDSSPKVADVWFYSSPDDTSKSAGEWKTVLVSGLRKGGKTFFALNITDTASPKYLWEFPLPTDSTTYGKLGQSWSEPAIGRVKIQVTGYSGVYERWVAFVGGGFDYFNKVGKIFYVLDLQTGTPIWSFSTGMNYSLAGSPTAVDINLDGYIDKVYIADLGGQLWVFDISANSTTSWTGKILLKTPPGQTKNHQFYNQPAVAFDRYRKPWVYIGTGDKEYPNEFNSDPSRFYAVMDNDTGTYPRTEGDLKDVTSVNTFAQDLTKKGWYIVLDKVNGKYVEKVLSKAAVFDRLVYFTTYSNTSNSVQDPCLVQGISRLYVAEYVSGGGALEVDSLSDLSGSPSDRWKEIGDGAPLTPVISVNSRASGSLAVGTTSGKIYTQKVFAPSSDRTILYWREVKP